MDEFFDWLNIELTKRGISNNELARRAGMSSANMSKAMTGKIAVTWDFCAGVAMALGYAPEDVFRKAGLLPPVANPQAVQAIVDVARHLSPVNQALYRDLGQFLFRRQQEEERDG